MNLILVTLLTVSMGAAVGRLVAVAALTAALKPAPCQRSWADYLAEAHALGSPTPIHDAMILRGHDQGVRQLL